MPNSPMRSFHRHELPEDLIEFAGKEGKKRFLSALVNGGAEAFFPLVSHFQTQSHPALCGLTSLCTVLNALDIDPERVWKAPWRWFTEALFNCCETYERAKQFGISIDLMACVARCEGAEVSILRDADIATAREFIKRSVSSRPEGGFEFVVASYDRAGLKQTGSGHFSPVAAYDVATDSVLILDVARFKYAPHWVDVSLLVEATKPIDEETGLSRGFLSFRKSDVASAHGKCKSHNCCMKKFADESGATDETV